jgi:DNA-binding IclR family transcriptional regulator
MSEPRTFRVRLILAKIGRPLSVAEVAPLLGATKRQTHSAIENLVTQDLARRVRVGTSARYEAIL